jgi:hypothetical protein
MRRKPGQVVVVGLSLLIVCALLATGGCLRLQVAKWDVSPGGQDEQRGYHAKLMKLDDGVTTRADVERLLGRPDLTERDGQLAAYRWQRVRYEAYTRLFDLGDDDRDCDDDDYDYEVEEAAVLYSSLLLEFDDTGVLSRHRKLRHRVEYGGPPTLPDLLAAWRDEVAAR